MPRYYSPSLEPKVIVIPEGGKYRISLDLAVKSVSSKNKPGEIRILVSQPEAAITVNIPMIRINNSGNKHCSTVVIMRDNTTLKLVQMGMCKVTVTKIMLKVDRI
jgi:hypothetical protein